MTNLAARSTDKPAGPIEQSLIARSKGHAEMRLQRDEIGAFFAEIGDPALLRLLGDTRNGSPICKVGEAILVVDLPPVRTAAQMAPAPSDTERVAALERDVQDIKGNLAEMLALLKAKA